ncbi:hypothetical protein LWI28_026486 [Acer negundo]|uniref:Uncharacterized protein n=1 Tax=Acer negundo TaxID=4023 RepID=A0AAD5NMC1_ACENE|nr:hypothetical protein LWI28_026486 [Acer negundo]KAK4840625.1 hypothetical protein QYF36_014197 [Acer negundo]
MDEVVAVVDNNSSSSTAPAPATDRQRFYIELRPGETTIVSWKKLIKEAEKNKNKNKNKSNNPSPDPAPAPASAVVTSNDDEAYKVQAALDEYFQDENPTTKYNNFIVNKEKLELLNEPISSADCQLRKRKQYMPNAFTEIDDHVTSKHAKLGHARPKVAAKNIPLVGQSSSHSQSSAIKSETHHDRKSQHALVSSIGCSRKKLAGTSPKSEYSLYLGSIEEASALLSNSEDTEKLRIGTSQSRNSGSDLEDASKFSGVTHLKYEDRNASKQFDPQGKRTLTDSSELECSSNVLKRQKTGSNGLPDLNIPASPIEPMKTTTNSKDVSSLRPKGTTLERAIRDLEKVVAESRPANMEVQNVVTSSIAIKRRLPREVKQKLAKVARLAQSSQGKISEELVNRLMSILGHLVQLRTLKRNLREMVLLGLSAKREKADRFQQIKMEVIEMIKLQEAFNLEKVVEEKFEMDNTLEDKICDLYDLYIQGMDEDKGPQIRKLYAELAELWPYGAMDNHGIKKAICRAKERRRALYDHEKVQEKFRSKKSSMPRTVDIVHGEVISMSQPQAVHERLITESNTHIITSPNKMISNAATLNHHVAAPPVRLSSPMLKASNMDLPKQEKPERMIPVSKEQVKQQHQRELENGINKLSLIKSNKEPRKSQKRAGGHPDGSNHQLAGPPIM